MPTRFDFGPLVPLMDRPRLAACLAPLVEAGYRVRVDVPDSLTALGWQIFLSKPGLASVFRMEMSATIAERAALVANILRNLSVG
jgi:hypothetical protein